MNASPNELEWQRLATSSDGRIRSLALRLQLEPVARLFFPYASHHDLRISRTSEYPWDNAGLPYITSRADDVNCYLAKEAGGAPRFEGDIEGVVQCFVALVNEVVESSGRTS